MGSRPIALVGALLLLAPGLVAQEQRGALEGTVNDSSGAVVPGARVEARSSAGRVLEAVMDRAGTYRFPATPPGRWDVSAALTGFRTARVEGVPLALGQLLRVNLVLVVGEVSEHVDVQGSPLVDVRQSARFTNIRDENVDKLPKGRDFTSLVVQAPGANWEKKSFGLSIDGATEGENRYMVDGLETTNPVWGVSGIDVVTDLVEEVQVKSSGLAAEFGGRRVGS